MRDFLKLIGFLFKSGDSKYSKMAVALVLISGVVAGGVSTGLLKEIATTLSADDLTTERINWTFIVLCAALPISRFISQVLLLRFSSNVTFDLRMRLSRRILSAPLRQLEKIRPHRLLGALTDDIGNITNALVQVPLISLQLTVIAGCLAFMAWMSLKLFFIVLGFVVIGVLSYQLPMILSLRHFRSVRERWDDVMKSFRGVTEGTKELKIHRPRREALVDEELWSAARKLRHHNVQGGMIVAAANSWGQVLFFVLIGLILFVFPHYMELTKEVTIAYSMTILYMLTPLDVVLNTISNLGRAITAVEKVQELGLSLEANATDGGTAPLSSSVAKWQEITFSDVSHSYYREDKDDMFKLGPVNFSISNGELVFLIGGNGSGKTTLAKVLIGLYKAESGKIFFNDEVIDDENRDTYRQIFSVVFSDFFIFEKFLGIEPEDLDENTKEYLSRLHLDSKVEVKNGVLSTSDLSQGQRKRLALLTAFLEDREIYLFDEWASDQDPQFKEIFYYKILPELKNRGKTVVVISHDDQYYHVAERIIKLDYGQIVYDGPQSEYNPVRLLADGRN